MSAKGQAVPFGSWKHLGPFLMRSGRRRVSRGRPASRAVRLVHGSNTSPSFLLEAFVRTGRVWALRFASGASRRTGSAPSSASPCKRSAGVRCFSWRNDPSETVTQAVAALALCAAFDTFRYVPGKPGTGSVLSLSLLGKLASRILILLRTSG